MNTSLQISSVVGVWSLPLSKPQVVDHRRMPLKFLQNACVRVWGLRVLEKFSGTCVGSWGLGVEGCVGVWGFRVLENGLGLECSCRMV